MAFSCFYTLLGLFFGLLNKFGGLGRLIYSTSMLWCCLELCLRLESLIGLSHSKTLTVTRLCSWHDRLSSSFKDPEKVAEMSASVSAEKLG